LSNSISLSQMSTFALGAVPELPKPQSPLCGRVSRLSKWTSEKSAAQCGSAASTSPRFFRRGLSRR
jgi:hypothetical protein